MEMNFNITRGVSATSFLYKAVIILAVVIPIVLLEATAVKGERFRSGLVDERPQDFDGRYSFNTGQVIKAETQDKRLWDYLAFLAPKKLLEAEKPFPAAEATELRARVRELTRQLVANSSENFLEELTITVSSFVNLNNLYKTSSLGRYIGEQMIGELQMAGAEVIDVRKSAGIMIHERHGEYGISREMEELSYVHAAQAIVVGTYTYASDQIFLNAKVLRNSDGKVLSNGSMVFDLAKLTQQMLSDEAMPMQGKSLVKVGGVEN